MYIKKYNLNNFTQLGKRISFHLYSITISPVAVTKPLYFHSNCGTQLHVNFNISIYL